MAIAALLHDVVEDCGGMPRLREIASNSATCCQDRRMAARIALFSRIRNGWSGKKKLYLAE